jgi:hypothetical protein
MLGRDGAKAASTSDASAGVREEASLGSTA